MADPMSRKSVPETSFISRRANASTFLVIEDDVYGEQPYIYVKIGQDYIIINDTGCNAPRRKDVTLTSLREYLETFPVPSNNYRSLNPGAKKRYVIICSHCHYDHILGLPDFVETNASIVASAFDKSFLNNDLPEHSLCKFVGRQTPDYNVSIWAAHMARLHLGKTTLPILFLHIPGHTPDSLAWYDINENHLYVGDMLYERKRSRPVPELDGDDDDSLMQGAIIFPDEGGDWIQYMSSLDRLLSFVQGRNRDTSASQYHGCQDATNRAKLSCGHITYNEEDAEGVLADVMTLFKKIIAGSVSRRYTFDKRGVVTDFWLENRDARYSVMAPRRLCEEAREHWKRGTTFGP